jgi:HSP20 family protein
MLVVRHDALISENQLNFQLPWQPATDVYRCADGWLIKVELAGVRQEDVHIQIDARRLMISGSRRDLRQIDHQETHLMEIFYSRFERLVTIPEAIENAEIRAEFRDGMLYVRVASKH